MTTPTNPTLAEQLAAAAAASREPTLGELFLRGAGSVQGDIQSFLRQLATSPQAASEAEKERERREKRGLRKRKRQLMAASAKTAAAAATSPPAQARKNESGPSSSTSKKAKTTKNESDRPRQAKTAANLASAAAAATTPVHPRPTTAPAATSAYSPSAPTTSQPWPVRPPPPVPTTTRHRSLPLICADAQCDCSGVHDPAAVSTQSLWKSREFEHGPYTNTSHLVSTSSSSFLVDPPVSPHLPSASSSSTLSSPVFSSTTTPTSNSMSLPPALSWVDSFFSSLGEMADLVEPSSSGCVEMAPPCATTSTTASSTLVSYSSAPSLRHLYPAIDDWPSPTGHHYPNHQHQLPNHHDYTPQRSPITDLLYSSTLSSSSSHHAPTWQSESWSSAQPPTPAPPRDQHTAAAGCACCPAPLAGVVGVGSPYPPGMSWLSGGGW